MATIQKTHFLREIITDSEISIDEILNESTGKKDKEYWIKGPFLQGNIKNHNGRIYLPDVLAKEATRFNAEMISQNRALGELNHPDTPAISFDRVSHMIKELKQDGDNFIGKAKVLPDMPCGKIVCSLMNEGVKFGVSSRGTGSLRQMGNGIMAVGPDYRLATIDIVANPSGPDCWVEAIMESREIFFDPQAGQWFTNYVEKTRQEISGMGAKKLQENKVKLFEQYLNKLVTK